MGKIKLIFLIIFFPAVVYGQNELEITLTKEQVKEDFLILKNSILSYHPDIYLYTPKSRMDSILVQIENSLEEVSLMEFYRNLYPIISSIRNKHTNLSLPMKTKVYIGTKAKRIPFSFLCRNDSLFVLRDASKEYLIKEESIITKINGIETNDLLEQMIKLQSADGYNKTLPLWDISRNFTKNYAVAFGTPEYFDIEYLNQDKSKNTVRIKAILKSEFSTNRETKILNNKLIYDFTVLNDIGILTIGSFDIGDLKKYNKFLKNTFDQIDNLRITKLIVDVRGNLGGRPEASDELLSYLIEKEIFPIKKQFSLINKLPETEYFIKDEAFNYFHKESFNKEDGKFIVKNSSKHKVNPKNNRFSGKLVFLINENCVSATASMLGQVKTHLNPIFIGSETGGNPVTVVANFSVKQILPNSKIVLTIPLIKSEKNVNFINKGRGIIPSIKIHPTVNNILNDDDIVLKKGIELVKR